jgi:NAD+ kinase
MIGLIAHSSKASARRALTTTLRCLRSAKVGFLIERETSALAGEVDGLSERDLAERCRVLLVLGGDGTILRVLHRLGARIRPIFGVNIGSLGFLTCVGPSEIPRAVQCLIDNDYILSPRSLLAAELSHPNHKPRKFFGLNDVVVSRGKHSELIKIDVSIDGIPFTDYHADGLIIATPTGSTAYSLSAGGPVLTPDSGCFVVTPICPHVLTNRSMVVSDRSTIEIRPATASNEVFVTVDGQGPVALETGGVLRVSRSRRTLPLAMLPGRLFPDVLRQKLKWSGSNV